MKRKVILIWTWNLRGIPLLIEKELVVADTTSYRIFDMLRDETGKRLKKILLWKVNQKIRCSVLTTSSILFSTTTRFRLMKSCFVFQFVRLILMLYPSLRLSKKNRYSLWIIFRLRSSNATGGLLEFKCNRTASTLKTWLI